MGVKAREKARGEDKVKKVKMKRKKARVRKVVEKKKARVRRGGRR
jgi:hypothetical protein